MFITTLKKKYITLIVIISILTGVNTTLAAYQTDVISDMALIYQGGTHRPEWTEDELRPYVIHTFADDVWTGFSTLFYFLNLQITGR